MQRKRGLLTGLGWAVKGLMLTVLRIMMPAGA